MSSEKKTDHKKNSMYAWPAQPENGQQRLLSPFANPEYAARYAANSRMRESNKLDLTPASAVRSRVKKWIYPDWVEQGELTILVGPVDGGKTTLQCLLAAGVTIGKSYLLHPELTPTGHGYVIIVNREDDFETTLKPCLEAAGADLDKVYFLGGQAGPGEESPFSFSCDRDMDRLAGFAERLDNNLGLIIIDPISFAVDGDPTNNYKARQAYDRLTQLAKRLQCAILGVAQAIENPAGKKALRRIAGPPALRQVPRSAMLLAKISDGPTEIGSTHVLVHAKNKGRTDGGFEYRIDPVEIPGENRTVPKFVITRELTGSADAILDRADFGVRVKGLGKKERAIDFLRTILSDGPRLRHEIEALAEEADIKLGTLLAAKSAMKLATQKRNGDGRSVWRLPDSGEGDTVVD